MLVTWTAPEITRVNGALGALAGDERTLADAWLDFYRQTLLWKCGGLTAEQLKLRTMEPSDLSLLGLVRHLAEVEGDWFRTRLAGENVGCLHAGAVMCAVFETMSRLCSVRPSERSSSRQSGFDTNSIYV